MKIGLIDVDGRASSGGRWRRSAFPNLALMKLSAWHKAMGDEVEMCLPLERYDRVYASKVFSFSRDIDFVPRTDDLRTGGTGYGVRRDDALPPDVEHMMPDYSLYGISDTAYGFMSRGCPRGCPFCIVAAKEGRRSVKVADLREFWDGQPEIKLMDPNTLACPDWSDILGQLAESGAWVDISQGADIRMLDDRRCEALNRLKAKMIHFAWDGNEDLEPLFRKWGEHLRFGERRRRCYVLVNFNTTPEWDLHRIYTLRECGYDPYVMVYDKVHAPKHVRRLQRWVNNKAVWRTVRTFGEYSRTVRREEEGRNWFFGQEDLA